MHFSSWFVWLSVPISTGIILLFIVAPHLRDESYLENQCQCQLQTWGRRHAGCSRQQLSGRADLIRIKLPIFMPFFMRMRMRYPRGERAATAQQLTSHGEPAATAPQRLQVKRAEIELQPAQYIHVHICMYLGQTYSHIHAHMHWPESIHMSMYVPVCIRYTGKYALDTAPKWKQIHTDTWIYMQIYLSMYPI
jgi:hypothetical protein